MLDHVRGAFRHATPTTARAEPAPLARKRHQAIDAASRTPQASEAGGQTAASQKVPKLLLDESREPLAVTQTGGLCPERLEVIADHVVQHTLVGMARLIGC
jgi:hypothetical protein